MDVFEFIYPTDFQIKNKLLITTSIIDKYHISIIKKTLKKDLKLKENKRTRE